jgi:phage FluMu protein Com
LTISIDNVYFADVQPSPDRGRCPVCRVTLLLRSPEEVVIRNAILKVDTPSGRVTVKCPRCKSWVEVPLRYVG